jgi:hypothetical protein
LHERAGNGDGSPDADGAPSQLLNTFARVIVIENEWTVHCLAFRGDRTYTETRVFPVVDGTPTGQDETYRGTFTATNTTVALTITAVTLGPRHIGETRLYQYSLSSARAGADEILSLDDSQDNDSDVLETDYASRCPPGSPPPSKGI